MVLIQIKKENSLIPNVYEKLVALPSQHLYFDTSAKTAIKPYHLEIPRKHRNSDYVGAVISNTNCETGTCS